jgi:hypothetical protein
MRCPFCNSEEGRQVFVGIGAELGPKFICGTIYWPSRQKATVIGAACTRIQMLLRANRESGSERHNGD